MTLRQFLQSIISGGRPGRHSRRPASGRLALRSEALEERLAPAVVAAFSPPSGVLSVFGDNQDNTIEVGRNAAGSILVNGGAVSIVGGTPTVANVSLIQVFGQGGNDTITMDEVNGALPRANLFGGTGNDLLTGGSAINLLFGQSGNDTLLGKGAIDLLFGGSEDDTLIGGDANDLMFGESGNDRMIWNPGDDTDLNEGGSGVDTVEVNGGGGAESFTVTANGTRVRFDRIDPAPFSIDIGTSEKLVLNANGGNDSFSATGNLAALIQITVDGGAGNDTLLGSNGQDLLVGGDGDDLVDGNQGNDTAFLGAGNDTFRWDPGDGSDVVEGQDGTDTMVFNGSGGAEIMEATANGQRLRFTRNLGNIVMDVDGTEHIDVNALGGSDTLIVNNLASTAVSEVNFDLAGTLGGSAGDAVADTVIVNGTNDADDIEVVGSGSQYSVVGLSAIVNVRNSEGANDSLVINALGGNDILNATTLPAGVVRLTMDGGDGDDQFLGSAGADVFLGGAGNDQIDGNAGNDLALMGAGDDTFVWDPGDGSDTVEGQDGTDKMIFNGSGADEDFDISANGARVRLFRNVGNISMDMNDLEEVDLNARTGQDTVVVGDLSGTDMVEVNLDLRGNDSGGDGQTDSVTVAGSNQADTIGIAGDSGGVVVTGVAAKVNLFHNDPQDRLSILALGGEDKVDASSLEAGAVQLSLFGGLGNDLLIGSLGDDFIDGDDGDDTAFMGAGDDTFAWQPGDDSDVIEGQDGFDTLQFVGSNAAENFSVSANGGRVIFFRDVASVTMDLDDTERLDLATLGGADVVVINDLAGTDLVDVNVDLASALGGSNGDAQPDTIIVNGTNGDDIVLAFGDANGTTVVGLATQVNIAHAEAANDRLVINGLAGDDVVEGSLMAAGAIQLVASGGAGNDILIGGDGSDVLTGGDGDDVLLGGPGLDVLDGGPGDNIVIQG